MLKLRGPPTQGLAWPLADDVWRVCLPADRDSDRDGAGDQGPSKSLACLVRAGQPAPPGYGLYLTTDPETATLAQCDNYCLMCSQPPKERDDTWLFDRARKVISLLPAGARSVSLTGGEPTLHAGALIGLLEHSQQVAPSSRSTCCRTAAASPTRPSPAATRPSASPPSWLASRCTPPNLACTTSSSRPPAPSARPSTASSTWPRSARRWRSGSWSSGTPDCLLLGVETTCVVIAERPGVLALSSLCVVVCNTIIRWAANGSIRTCWMRKIRSKSIRKPRTCSIKHPHLGIDDIDDVWASDPLFYPAKPPAHWLMCGEVGGRVRVVPLAPSRGGDRHRCRPIGCYEASAELAAQYRRDR